MNQADPAPVRAGPPDQGLAIGPFTLDPVRRVLRHGDQPVAISATLFDLLLYLARHPDRVVTKGELLDAVWPGRVVEEANVSQTIFALRKALAASGATESVIVTAPGKGYRLGMPVRDPGVAPVPPPIPVAATPPPRQRFRGVGLAALAAGLAVLGGFGWHYYEAGRAAEHPARIVVGDFENLTPDPMLKRALSLATEVELRQSPDLDVLSSDTIADTLALMTRPADTALQPAVAREVCQRNNGQVAITGAVTQIGGRWLLSLTATNCASGAALITQKAEVGRREELLPALDGMVDAVRSGLGEDAASIRAYAVPLQARQTASLEALEAYSEAVAAVQQGRRVESIQLFQRAIALDPRFVMAWVDLAAQYRNLHDAPHAADAAARAYALRDNAGPLDRLQLTVRYLETHDRDAGPILTTLHNLTRDYPGNAFGWAELANEETWYGDYAAAIAPAQRAVALEPDVETAHVILARALLRSGRIDAALAACQAAIRRHVDGDDLHGVLFQIAAFHHDAAAMDRELVWANGKQGQLTILIYAAQTAFAEGRIKAGLALFDQALALRQANGLPNVYAAPEARLLGDLGLTRLAMIKLGQVPKGFDSPDYRYALNALGDETAAADLLNADLAAAPADTLLHLVFAGEERAVRALRHDKPQTAVAALEPARPYELRNFDVLALRGAAYLASRDGANAALAYQAIIDHPGVEPQSEHYALAWLGLARARMLQRDQAGAKSAYATFLRLWQHADADVPVLVQARAEYAALTALAPARP